MNTHCSNNIQNGYFQYKGHSQIRKVIQFGVILEFL